MLSEGPSSSKWVNSNCLIDCFTFYLPFRIFQSSFKKDPLLNVEFENQVKLFVERNRIVSDWRCYFNVMSTLTGLFENISVTQEGCHALCDKMFDYVLDVFEQVGRLYFSQQASPSLTNEILLLNHNTLRLLLSLCQEFGGKLKECKCDFNRLIRSLERFLADKDVPMDTKTNCGHLTIIICKLNDGYEELISRKFNGRNNFCENVGIVVDLNRGDSLNTPDTWKLLNLITVQTMEYARENSKQQQMVLACSRLIFRVSKLLPQLPEKTSSDEELQSLVGHLIDFVFAHLENFMDSVRHMSRDSLKLILSYCLEKKIDNELDLLFQRIHSGCPTNVRFITVSCIAATYGGRRVIKEIPDIVSELIGHFKESSFDASAANSYEVLMLENKKEESTIDWINKWVEPLIAFLNDLPTSEQNVKIVVETLISKAVKNDQEVIRKLSENPQIPITIRLTVLSMAKKCGNLKCDQQSPNLWKGSIQTEELKAALVNFDDRIRIQALRLIAETHKITEPYEDIDLELLLFFYKFNSNSQSPATRDQFMALYKNCFLKVYALLCHHSKKKNAEAVEFYKNFLQQMRSQSFVNLKFNGNFSRRTMSLYFIDQIFSALRLANIADCLPSHSPTEIALLVKCLGDSYDCNKDLALKILRSYCSEQLILEKHSDLQLIKSLITSVNPLESTTGAYNLQLIVCLAKRDPNLYNTKLFVTLKWLKEIAEEGIELANLSLVRAARKNPIYGALQCIRILLSELDVQSVKCDQKWREFISDLIKICFASSEAVKSIVNNSSPEGHLPNDFGALQESELDQTDSVTPQMILLMGWRTIKEVSLLLGDLSKYPLVPAFNTDMGLVSMEEFFQIGDSFRELLAETKHRGAFEQAYVGFSKLCCRLWTAQEEELHRRPMSWLRELMDVVRGKAHFSSKICATRRSAGVPYMVQALITSEIQVCSSRALRYSMDILFELCESKESTAEARTHALNILRALFRCSDLNESVVEFVDRGVMAAISSFAGLTWPEKNSATLLFSALVIRIFGVQRTKDTDVLNVRNKMTGRIFFLRYPKLYDFLLKELEEARETLSQNGRNVKLFPILLVLSRLYPSALEGTESSLSLHAFVEKIENCSQCPEMKTRVLVGKSIASLLTSNVAWQYLADSLASFECAADLNVQHSKLLIAQQVLSSSELKCEIGSDDVDLVLKRLLGLQINFTHWILTKAYLEIFIVLCQRFGHNMGASLNTSKLKQELISRAGCSGEMGFVEVLTPFVIFQLQRCVGGVDIVANILKVIVSYMEIDVFLESTLGVLLLIMHDERQELPDDLELTKWERSFVNGLPCEVKDSLKQQLKGMSEIPQICNKVVQSGKSFYDFRNKALALLAYFPAMNCNGIGSNAPFERVLDELLDREVSYQVKAATLKWYLRNCVQLEHPLPLSVLHNYCTIENTFDVRMTSAEILKLIPVTEELLANDADIVRYIGVVLLLLRDDDAEVRESVSQMMNGLVYSGDMRCSVSIELYSQEMFLDWMEKKLRTTRGNETSKKILSNVIVDIQIGLQDDLTCVTEPESGNDEVCTMH